MASNASANAAELNESNKQLLIAILKSTNGTIDVHKIAELMALPTSSAAQKRVKRFFEKLDPNIPLSGSTLGTVDSDSPGPSRATRKKSSNDENATTPQTPKTLSTKEGPTTTEETPNDEPDEVPQTPVAKTPRKRAAPKTPRAPKSPKTAKAPRAKATKAKLKEEDDTDTIEAGDAKDGNDASDNENAAQVKIADGSPIKKPKLGAAKPQDVAGADAEEQD